MTTDTIGLFFFRRPFVGFDMHLVDGRIVRVSHPETASVGKHLTTVLLVDGDGRSEVIDTAMIVSCRTVRPVSLEPDDANPDDGDEDPNGVA